MIPTIEVVEECMYDRIMKVIPKYPTCRLLAIHFKTSTALINAHLKKMIDNNQVKKQKKRVKYSDENAYRETSYYTIIGRIK